MMQIYSQEDLILYAYNETELNDSVRIQNAIDSDPLVESEYKEITDTLNFLDRLLLEPDEKVMNRLMEVIGN
ncbi:MAG TPA: hypothetical protein VI757_14410 [Bacteroidia bacterium]|nr:hypothetical protein [Bacteroidia bacterium]